MLVGLRVEDEEAYRRYREGMLPILKRHGGGFRYDFQVARVLISATPEPINRVFAIFFGSEAEKNAFFTNQDYIAVKERFFKSSVSSTTIIAAYERPD